MEFLSDYGLFLAKTITLLISLVIAVAIIASANHKNKKNDDDDIDIEKINERLTDYSDLMKNAILEESELKSLHKEEKKQAKLDKKQAKLDQKKSKIEDIATTQETSKKRVFVASFDGDVKASEVDELRKLITVILTQAKSTDEVVVKIESSGGMVHSYGLASSQLDRVVGKNIPLTVCVDKVAASGGYMMACVADKILAAPFAIIGSIGVIAQVPNFSKLLKKSNIDYEMHTAGEYKRTLTMFGENTDKGREKFVEELEDTHELFKDFVKEHREVVDVVDVATGEIWFGKRALDKRLIDEIKTSDQYLCELAETCDVFELSISQKQNLAEKLGLSFGAAIERSFNSAFSLISNRYF